MKRPIAVWVACHLSGAEKCERLQAREAELVSKEADACARIKELQDDNRKLRDLAGMTEQERNMSAQVPSLLTLILLMFGSSKRLPLHGSIRLDKDLLNAISFAV